MAINKKFISFATQAQFDAKVAELDDRSIVFIEDTKRIWTHGVFFDTSWNYVTGKPNTLSDYGITDVPQDGKIYGRKNGGWTEVGSDPYDWTWLFAIPPPSGTCTQQQYNDLLAAVQTGNLFPHPATFYAVPYPIPEIEGDYIVLSWIEVYYDNSVQSRSWYISPDLSVSVFMANNTGEGAYVPTSRKVAGKALTSDITLVKGDVGLGNVNNTSDANKPVSTAQAAAIALKIDADKFQVVTSLPASPVSGTFYFVKE